MIKNFIFNIIVCPICKEKLIFKINENILVCKKEKIYFTIENGIPIMLKEKAKKLLN